MMNSSSHFKAKIALFIAVAAVITAEISELAGLPDAMETIGMAIGVIAILVALTFMARSNKELRRTKSVLDAVVAGDFETRLTTISEGGNFGAMQNAVNDFIDLTDAYIRESQACQEFVSDNKYFRRMLPGGLRGSFLNAAHVFNKAGETTARKVESFGKITDDFESKMKSAMETVASAATELQATAGGMKDSASETGHSAEVVSKASNDASNNVQTVASAAEELSSSISEISRQVSQSTTMSSAAVTEVDGANTQVQGLAVAANKIGEVIGLISDIAEQTNLLALNATIEAARAGEAGKGFAVVASEVKNLASQTAKATEDISSQIGGIQAATQDAVGAIQSIGDTIHQMNEVSSTIAAAVEEQGAATQEIARNVEQAASGTTEVSNNIQSVTKSAGQTGESADDVLTAAGELSQQSEMLRSEMDSFLGEMRQVL